MSKKKWSHNVLDLNLRENPEGGRVKKGAGISRSKVRLNGDQSHLVILVHGFNVTLYEANNAYEHYLQRLPRGFPSILRVYWPGDENLSIFRPLYYPWALDPAKESAHELITSIRKYRQRRGGLPRKVTFVAHSLGCRLVTELLEEVSMGYSSDWPEVEFVCMMAAAVPMGLGDRGGELRKALDKLAQPDGVRSDKLMLLYSPDDLVLRFAFMPGQAIARLRRNKEDVKNSRAIGLFGEPVDLTRRRYQVMNAGHSDYWPSYEAIMYVGTHLSIAVPRELAQRKIQVRKLSSFWSLKSRKIDSRYPGIATDYVYSE